MFVLYVCVCLFYFVLTLYIFVYVELLSVYFVYVFRTILRYITLNEERVR
jgi:hypothetical protein